MVHEQVLGEGSSEFLSPSGVSREAGPGAGVPGGIPPLSTLSFSIQLCGGEGTLDSKAPKGLDRPCAPACCSSGASALPAGLGLRLPGMGAGSWQGCWVAQVGDGSQHPTFVSRGHIGDVVCPAGRYCSSTCPSP